MKQAVIPWHVFWEALGKLPKGKRRDEWLQRWLFSEKGAVLALSIEAAERSSSHKEIMTVR